MKMLSKSGIYKITNLITNEIYVGASKNIKRRWSDHRTRMKQPQGKEYNKELYVAMREYGLENFAIEVIEECQEKMFVEKEAFWIKKLDTINKGYNGYGLDKHHKAIATKEDVIKIRTRYANKERKSDVYKDYTEKLSYGGFKKIWTGENWKSIMPEVYTKKNKKQHRKNTGNAGKKNGMAMLIEEEIKQIRLFKKEKKHPKEIYDIFKEKITWGSFLNIWYGYTWKHVL